MDEVSTLEHTTLKVPYEILNKKFRASQKTLDREVALITNASNELTTCVSKPSATVEDVSGILDGISKKLTNMKRKAAECLDEELESTRLCRVRLDHLKSYASGEQAEVQKNVWRRARVDRMLVDHFLREGHYGAAIKLAESSKLENLVDIDIFLACQKVEEALRAHNTEPCLSWCYDNRSKLRRMKSNLEFTVRLQDFVELVKQGKRSEAVRYARKNLSTSVEDIKELQTAMGLVAFPVTVPLERYQRLLSETRWEDLIKQFRQENFSLYQLSTHSTFSVALQAGLSALKTPQCYKPEEFNPQCPVCAKPFNELAHLLPFAHCSQSYLICTISGKPMNEHNPPMVLPNGYVYGEQALKKMAQEKGGVVTCPRTKETFLFSAIKKVYVM
eukprot:Em0013g120a